MGMPALAMTDHGQLFGAVDFYLAGQKHGVKPILGVEAYLAPGSRFEKQRRDTAEPYSHLTLLAENQTGYANLLRLVSAASLEGFFYKPRMDRELFERYGEGLIATSGCLGSEVNQRLLKGDQKGAAATLAEFRDLFGPGNYFVELHDHGLPEQRRVNPDLIALARDLGLPLLAANDLHYTRKADAGPARGAALHPDRGRAGRPQAVQAGRRVRGVLPQVPGRDARPVRRLPRGLRQHPRGGRALQRAAPLRREPPAPLRRARRPHPGVVAAGRGRAGRGRALRRSAAPRRPRPDRLRAPGHRPARLRRLLPDRGRPVPPRPRARHPGRPGAGERGRLLRLLLPARHRPRPDRLRADVRALPQPGPQRDARHRPGLRRAPARRHDPLRHREVRRRPRRPDRHLLHHQGQAGHPRLGPGARVPLQAGRRPGQGHAPAGAGQGAPPERGLQALGRAAGGPRQRPRRPPGAGHRRRAGGAAPPVGGPRGRGGDLPRPAGRAGPDHEAGGRRGDHHPVRDERGGQARAAQDGLPRPAQPDGAGRHPGPPPGQGDRAGPGGAAHRRPGHLQDAPGRRLRRRLPDGVGGHAAAAAPAPTRPVRGHRRPDRPVPAGPDGGDPQVHRGQARPQAGQAPAPADGGDHRRHPRGAGLPGADHHPAPEGGRLHRRRGRPGPQGHRQEDRSPDAQGGAALPGRLPREGPQRRPGRHPVAADPAVRRLLLQPGPRRRLRPGRLADRLPQGPPPGRLHGGPADQRQGRQGRPPQVPRVLPPHGHHRAAPRRQRVRLELHPPGGSGRR